MNTLQFSFAWKHLLKATPFRTGLLWLHGKPRDLLVSNLSGDRSDRFPECRRLLRGVAAWHLSAPPFQLSKILTQRIRADLVALAPHGFSNAVVAVPLPHEFSDPLSVSINDLKQGWLLVRLLSG